MAVYLIDLSKVHHIHGINHNQPMMFHQRVVGFLVVNEQQTN
jgi:hypothetical protein